jgi:hypothetical protein
MKTWLTMMSFTLAVAAAISLLVLPIYTGFDGSRTTGATVLQVNGLWTFISLLFPVITAMATLIFPTRGVRIFAAILMCAFTLLSAFTLGLFYLPAAGVMLIAACITPKHPDARLRRSANA